MKGKVLIIDDRTDNLIAGIEAMKELGIEGIGVMELKAALEIIRKKDLLLVLTDMQMKEGAEAGMEIVKECCKGAIPVGVITMRSGHGHHKDEVRLLIPKLPFSERLIKIETLGGEEKDVDAYKKAFKRLKKEVHLEENFATRKRYRKYVGRGFMEE